jgi:hypothetical protein
VIEKNGGRGHAAPILNELGKGQEKEEDAVTLSFYFVLAARPGFARVQC